MAVTTRLPPSGDSHRLQVHKPCKPVKDYFRKKGQFVYTMIRFDIKFKRNIERCV